MSLIKIVVIPADSSQAVEVREIEATPEVMGGIVGGWLEVVGLTGPLASLYINEEGKLRRLPLNQRATALVQRHNAMLGDFIVGDVFIAGPPDLEGNDTDAPEEYQRLVD